MDSNFSPQDGRTDETLCELAKLGDRAAEEALVLRHTRLVRVCARPYFLTGGDSEDLIQEGMVGLLAAIREFDPAKGAGFHRYAEICIKNRLISAIKAATRDKHTPLNNYISFETPFFDGNEEAYAYGAPRHGLDNPEDVVIGREEFRERMAALKGQLSGFEAEILGLYLNGLSYSEIAHEVKRSPKSVDNAVQRIRRKLAQHFSSGDFSAS